MGNELIKKYKQRIKYYVVFAIIMFGFSFIWIARNEIFEGMCCLLTAIVSALVSIVNLVKLKREKELD